MERESIHKGSIEVVFLEPKKAPSILNVIEPSFDITPDDLISNLSEQKLVVRVGEGVASDLRGFEVVETLRDEVVISVRNTETKPVEISVVEGSGGRVVELDLTGTTLERGQYYVRLIHGINIGTERETTVLSLKSVDDPQRSSGELQQGAIFRIGDTPSIKEVQAERVIDSSDKRIYGALTVISSEREDLSSLNKSESGEKERLNRFGEILKRGDLTLTTASEYRSADGQKITFGIISDPDKSDGEVETTDSEYKVTKEYNGSSGVP